MRFGRFNRLLILWGASCGMAFAEPSSTPPKMPSQKAPAATPNQNPTAPQAAPSAAGTPAAANAAGTANTPAAANAAGTANSPAAPNAAGTANSPAAAKTAVKPAAPANPTQPAKPAAPANPTQPAKPAAPANPTQPAKPAAATQATASQAAKPTENAVAILDKAFSTIAAEKSASLSVQQKIDFLQAITSLRTHSHPIDSTKASPKADPILLNLQIDPQSLLGNAEKMVQVNAIAQAQYTAVGLIRVCAECHATTVAKPAWKNLQPNPQLSEFERGQFYKMVGKDNEALLSFERVMNTKGLAASRRDIWERSASSLVGLAIRREDSPFTFIDILSNTLGSAGLPTPQKELLTRWRTAGKAWDKEAPARNANEALQKAQVLMNFSRSAKDPQSSFIESSRAMNLLRLAQTGSAKGQAYRLAGEMRERLSPDGIWFNAEDYYQACIRSSPKSVDAGQCWDLLRSLPQRNKNFVINEDVQRQLQPLAR